MVKGYPTWNVKIEDTLNSLPPQVHENGLTNNLKNHSKIDYVKTVKDSDIIMTGSNDGSINIWHSKLNLQLLGSHNFKSKFYNEEEINACSANLLISQLI